MPAQAKENTPEGASAFVDHYVDVLNYAAATGDVDELSRLSSSACDGCQTYIGLYRDTYAAGGYFIGGQWEIGEILLAENNSEVVVATTTITTTATKYRETSKSPEQSGPAETNKISFGVSKAPDRTITRLARGAAL